MRAKRTVTVLSSDIRPALPNETIRFTHKNRKNMKPEYKPFVDALIELAIREDIGDGDHTSPMSSLMQSSIRASTNGLYSAFISLRFSMQSYKRIVPLYTALWSSVSSPTGICALRQVKITSRLPLASLPVNIGIANPLPVCGS